MKTTGKLKSPNHSTAYFARTKVLPYVRDYATLYGQSPSLADVAGAFGRTRQWAKDQVDSLVEQGLATTVRGKYRSIKIKDKKNV
jgi:hypothetical protein